MMLVLKFLRGLAGLAMLCDDGMYCEDCSVELGTRLGDGCVQCRYLVWSW